jgi:hypothetical protein
VSENGDAALGPEPTVAEPPAATARSKRSWKSRLIELALWAALSIVIAVVMIALSDKLLPNNF